MPRAAPSTQVNARADTMHTDRPLHNYTTQDVAAATEESATPATAHSRSAPDATGTDEEKLEALRDILLGQHRQRIAELQTELDDLHATLTLLDERINDKSALVETITPIIAASIRTSIRDSRDEMVRALNPIIAETIRSNVNDSRDAMIEALYPITGRLVQRSVTESMRDLARRIDHQMRAALSVRGMMRRVQARARGISAAEFALRESLPFQVSELFFVHRETGILLYYLSDRQPRHGELDGDLAGESEMEEEPFDSDLISGMLTAIQDFVQDAFGRGEEGQLDEVQYGNKQILIEAAQYTYIAVVVQGIEPSGFRAEMRDEAYEIERDCAKTLRSFDGDVAALQPAARRLQKLVRSTEPQTNTEDDAAADASPSITALRRYATREISMAQLTTWASVGLYAVLLLFALWQIWLAHTGVITAPG